MTRNALNYLYYPARIAETPKYQELDSATKILITIMI